MCEQVTPTSIPAVYVTVFGDAIEDVAAAQRCAEASFHGADVTLTDTVDTAPDWPYPAGRRYTFAPTHLLP